MTSHQANTWIDDAMIDAQERATRGVLMKGDPIKPSHYNVGGIETIDYIKAKLGKTGYEGYCLGNILKYVSRADHKDGVQDLKKAAKYLEWLIESKSE